MVGCTHVGNFYKLKNEVVGNLRVGGGLQNYSIPLQLGPDTGRLCALRRGSRNRRLTHPSTNGRRNCQMQSFEVWRDGLELLHNTNPIAYQSTLINQPDPQTPDPRLYCGFVCRSLYYIQHTVHVKAYVKYSANYAT
jgi:hypothetical protein